MWDEMQPGRDPRSDRSGVGLSLLIHGMVLLTIAGILHGSMKLAPYRLPGTRDGVQFITYYYSPGSVKSGRNDIPAKTVSKQQPVSVVHSEIAPPKADTPTAPSAERGEGSSGLSGLGDGNITIALQKYFPYPKPSLSTLPHGAAGDVILTAVIDEHGKIAELTLLQGLGPAIDDEVIQTVNQWTYTPATKNGVAVPSVQELHFHYERRG
jgi:protein TonB